MKKLASQSSDFNLQRLIIKAARSSTEVFEQLKFLSNIISELNFAIYLYDLKRSCHTWTNHNFRKICGYSEEEVHRQSPEWIKENFHPDDLTVLFDRIEYFRKNMGNKYSGIYRIKHKEGQWVWIYSNCVVYKRDVNDEPEIILGVAIDFTDNFKTLKQFAELNRENQRLRNEIIISRLTTREKEIMIMIAAGKTCHSIAEELHISLHTANNHRKKILQKLNLHRVSDIARFAGESGMGIEGY